jgi:hypothetical protein
MTAVVVGRDGSRLLRLLDIASRHAIGITRKLMGGYNVRGSGYNRDYDKRMP